MYAGLDLSRKRLDFHLLDSEGASRCGRRSSCATSRCLLSTSPCASSSRWKKTWRRPDEAFFNSPFEMDRQHKAVNGRDDRGGGRSAARTCRVHVRLEEPG
jgi:hypothetical protein